MVQRQIGELTLTLPSDREIVMTRVFDAPRELVFEAHSKCEHLRELVGPESYTLTVCEMDFRPAAPVASSQRDTDGNGVRVQGRVSRDRAARADRLDL